MQNDNGGLVLLDLLPCRLDAGSDGQRIDLPVAMAAQDAVRLALARNDGSAAAGLLCQALVLTDLLLTGSKHALATVLGPEGIRQASVERPAVAISAWSDAGNGIPRDVAGEPQQVAWAVVEDGLPGTRRGVPAATSHWQLCGVDRPHIQVDFQGPLTAAAVELLAACVQRVLAVLVEEGGGSLDAIDLMAPGERHRQLVEWNDTAVPRSPGDTVHGIFASVRAQAPDAIAVTDDVSTLTYAQLDRHADVLADRLRREGAVPGAIVGVALERSVAAIVAVLGILKAGAAYLPLDATQPPDRIAFMIEDAGAELVVVEDGADACAALPHTVRRIAVETRAAAGGWDTPIEVGPSEASPFDAAPFDAGVDGDALAYVMYTSGSTGAPKGVEIRHRSILRLVRGVDYVALGPDTRMLHCAPPGFDASTFELWGALLNAGCVVVHGEAVPTGNGLQRTIARHGVTSAWLTASLFNAVVDEDPRKLYGLRELFTGGEALSVGHVLRMREAVPSVRLHNGYGPTECTTFASTYPVPEHLDPGTASIPIGRPIADTRFYVLNQRRQPVPIGIVGELHIGGEGLARGYLDRPELTAAQFVPDPFGPPGERLYRTGDHVRYRTDGNLEFVGRIDGQVKIRGFRIELGEIENALVGCPGVKSCAVLARSDGPGGTWLVAYYVADADPPPAPPQLRARLAATLPEFMVPARYMRLEAMPVTINGKLDRRALPVPGRERPVLAAAFEPARDAAERRICDAFADLLDIDQVGRHDNFFEIGGSSLLAVRLMETVRREWVDVTETQVTLLFRYPTPAALAAVLQGSLQTAIEPARLARPRRRGGGDDDRAIAIVAMAGRFPGAADVEALWRNLCEGRDSITFFTTGELDASVGACERLDPDHVPARGVIDDVELFDAAFFGIGAREAELMDPQQRIFLELCWECLERAGHVPDATTVPVGVFAGMHNATYFQRHLAAHPDLIAKFGAFQVMLDNEKDYITSRVAHRLNLTGPAVSVNSACSTSLVAICQAMDSLRAGRCDMALAGGASVTCPPRSGYRYQEGSMLSPDGRTRSFDARAQGTVFSDGAAVVLLKRLPDAIADGNVIHAVIRGGAVNNDGGNKGSFTAPSSDGQAAVIAMAHDDAGVVARDISYVEAHGTATPLGDPIEIEGLTRAFRRSTHDTGFCRIGSVKSNVGHLVIAAGATGLIKTALSLAERRIPASLHFTEPNPALRLEESPFVVNASLEAWPDQDAPRLAGVSSFGVGGTNAHVVMEEAPPPSVTEPADGPQLIVLSARTPTALASASNRLADHLDGNRGENLADVAWTLGVGRKAFAHRIALCADSVPDAIERLRSPDTLAAASLGQAASVGGVVFMFPGQGAQYAGMGRELHAREPAFRAAFDECIDALRGEVGFDLREIVAAGDAEALLPTSVMQPAIFVIEYALARFWMDLGLRPTAMIGHSVGEFVAATLAGVFTLPDAMRLVARRGRMMQAQPAGGMLSVRLAFADLASRLDPGLSLAAENAPGSCVVAGPLDVLAALQSALGAEGVACRALRTSHAFHSVMMDAVVAPFRDEVAAVSRASPRLPIMSTVTADWLDAKTAASPEYWARHLREPVRFASALARLLDAPDQVLLEVGPRTTLCTLARQHPDVQKQGATTVASLADAVDGEVAALRLAVGQAWCRGADVDPAALDHRGLRRRLRLPTYPFERQRHWVEATPAHVPGGDRAAASVDTVMETVMQQSTIAPATVDRKARLVARLREEFEDIAGFEMSDADASANFMELGLDSLMLTQIALQLQNSYRVKVTFRQLMGEYASLERLAAALDEQLPAEPMGPQEPASAPGLALTPMPTPTPTPTPTSEVTTDAAWALPTTGLPWIAGTADSDLVRGVIAAQMELMAQQLALLSGGQASGVPVAAQAAAGCPAGDEDEVALAHTTYDVRKAFGAIARIDSSGGLELDAHQRERLDAFIARYVARTRKSKEYTQAHRGHMADPRVVNGFRPLLKEIVYQIVIGRSRGAHLEDIDGNDYVDALNGFGMSLFGWQPDFVLDAVRRQLELGYEIGPQHPLSGEVARLVCEITGHDRAALCNTGSEAVLGALRIARTVTGRSTVVLFSGAYHGIIDEVIVRGTKKLRAVPAAPGIMRNTADNVLVLDYGTPEAMDVIRARAGEIAAVLVEPVQSRRPDLRPIEFLRELRALTAESGSLLIFDEVVTGFRAHPAGAQGLFGIKADLATYGKVVGGGYPIGVIAGQRKYMDALDGGHWQFGDDSVPSVGVTYFAGTFVRHPLALAAARAVLEHIKAQGGGMQERLNARAEAMATEINAFCAKVGAPIEVRWFASVWKTFFLEDHPLQDLLFAMMRSRGVHILDNFPCFLTTAHEAADVQRIVQAFKDSVVELQESGFLPRRLGTADTVMGSATTCTASALAATDYDPFAGGALARVVPTTEPQREIWLADQLGRDASLAYNESVSLRLKGALDVAALRAALQSLLERHDALRASIGPDGETLCIADGMQLEVGLRDVSALAPVERETVIQDRLRAAVDTPFSLQHDPLFRAELLRLAPDDHLLVLTAHHIVCDGWSWWVLVRGLAGAYAAGGSAAGLPAAGSYADYALSLAARDGGGASVEDEHYWLTRLAGQAPVLDLPTDRPRAQQRSFASAREDFVFDAELVAAVRKLGAQRGASLFATLLAGFAGLLARLTGQHQVVVGVPAAGQAVDGHENLVGHCVNTLPLLFDVDMARTVGEAIDDAQATLLDALEHQRYTFGTLLRKLRVDRDPSRLPLISVLFNIDQALDHEDAAFPGLTLEFATNARNSENFELFINAVQVHDALRLECQYNRDLFDAATIRRWMHGYATLLREAVAHADATLGSLPLVDGETMRMLLAMQPARTSYAVDCGMHQLFERQCDRDPDRVALRCGSRSLTYAQLETRANRIATMLRARGIRRGALVGLAVDRDIDMPAAVLGILKTGAGYVPLDPGFPPERLACMVGDAGLAALVTERKHAAGFDLRGRPVLVLDALTEELERSLPARPREGAGIDPESVAYVIYTSGSTGRPKGVQVPHRAVSNFIAAMQERPGIAADDCLLAVTTLSFDIAVLELFLPWSIGAEVVLADRDTAMDGARLSALLATSGASVMQATPATWRLLIDAGWRGGDGFRALCGGEPLAPDLASALLVRCAALWNLYGPTETTVWSTCSRVASVEGGITIGTPIANTTVFILDPQGQVCPLGVPGELCIGGDGMTLGYLGRDDLTRERFVPDPFSDRPGARLYRTGDLARWRADGLLEHLGRIDSQVKVRGYRIEPGEIEAAIAAGPDVADQVVLVREDRPGDVRLVAYVVAGREGSVDGQALLARLRRSLPEYMIPQHVVALDALPRLPNGKTDRKSLPPPIADTAREAPMAPRNALERRIVDTMAQVLGQSEVGIHDSFFALGGHSLLAAQLTTRLNRDLGASLSLRTVFDAPTAAQLAERVEASRGAAPPARARIVRRERQDRAPLSLVQERLRLIEAYNPGSVSYNTPSAHRLKGPLDAARLDRALRMLADRQTVLRTSIRIEDGQAMQVVHDAVDPGISTVIDLSQLPEARRETELHAHMQALINVPFSDLAQPPLYRARLFKLREDEHALFFMPHHIIWDGWSFDLLYSDLAEIYAALGEGRKPALPELPVTYGDYAAWHNDWVAGSEYQEQVRFWRERLGAPNAQGGRPQALPTDKPRRPGMSGASRSCKIVLPREIVDALHATSRAMDTTIFVTLLSVYCALLAHTSGQRDMVVGTPVRGRNLSEVEGLMGYFTNLLPLRFEVDPAWPFSGFAASVRGVVLDSFAFPDIRLEDLTRELGLRSDGGGTMLYQALFSFQDIRQRVVRWGDLDHSRIEVFQPGATEDLGLWFVEDAGGMAGGLIYNADILEDRSILRLRSRFLDMLTSVVRDPSQTIAELCEACDAADHATLPDPFGLHDLQQDLRNEPGNAIGATEHAAGERLQPVTAAPGTAAASSREDYLIGLWSELLGARVDVSDNFFELGGNSMLAVQMAERVARDTGVRIKLMRLAVQSLGEIATELPGPHQGAGRLGQRLMRNVRRLFGN